MHNRLTERLSEILTEEEMYRYSRWKIWQRFFQGWYEKKTLDALLTITRTNYQHWLRDKERTQ